MEGVHLLGFLVEKSNMVGGGGACGIVKAHEGVELKLRPYFLTLGA